MKRTIEQRKAYALHRMSAALDRVIRITSEEKKERANKWVKAWQDYLIAVQAPTSGALDKVVNRRPDAVCKHQLVPSTGIEPVSSA